MSKIAILGDTHFGMRGDSIAFHNHYREFYSKHFIENYPIAKELISEGRLEFVSLNLEPDSVYFGVETAHRIEFSKWVKTNVQEDYVGILCDCDEIVSDHVVNVCDDLNFIMCLEMKLFYALMRIKVGHPMTH